MKTKPDRIQDLSENFSLLFEQERKACLDLLRSLQDAVRTLQGDMADRRLQRLSGQIRQLQDRIEVFSGLVHRDFFTHLKEEAAALGRELNDGRLAKVLSALINDQTPALNRFCDSLLDGLINATGAERGFILFYLPESTEADIIAARNFQTTHLSLSEYQFSRTLLRDLFQRGEPLLLEDASHHQTYSKEKSIVNLQIMAVLAAPLKQGNRTVGAVYLENNRIPGAFDETDFKLVESAAQFAIFYLQHARLLPVLFEPDRRVFIEPSKASKEILGNHPKMVQLLAVIQHIADSPATVLIEGESGTGKELVARALHDQSARREHPFVAINCAAIPEDLLESELFGHEKGAFTGATEQYIGRIEQGDGGIVFFDEISELAYPLQAKLLRFLQSNEFGRLGGRQTVQVDVRTVAATSKNLKALVDAGKFYDALYYRLNVIPILVPPLRERKQDIPLLVNHFLAKFSSAYGKTVHLEPEVVDWFMDYPFPGNVRELENVIHRLVALSTDETVRIGDLPPEILQIPSHRVSLRKDPFFQVFHTPPANLEELQKRKQETKRLLAEQERQLAERAIQEAQGNLTKAAAHLGVHRVTLHKMVRKNRKP